MRHPPPVLDACCGSRMFWFDKQDPRAVFVDARRERHTLADVSSKGGSRELIIEPDIQCNFTTLPFLDDTFSLVVFDPPHFERNGQNGWIGLKYGTLGTGWQGIIKSGFSECFRVLKPGGTLIFKWCADEIPVSTILTLTPQTPLFGHKSGKQQKTHWIAFLKPTPMRELTQAETAEIIRKAEEKRSQTNNFPKNNLTDGHHDDTTVSPAQQGTTEKPRTHMNPKLNALFLALASVAVLAADFFKSAAGEAPATPPAPDEKPKKPKAAKDAPAAAPTPATTPCDLDVGEDDDCITLGGEAEPVNYVELRAKIKANVVKNKDSADWRKGTYFPALAAAGIAKGVDFASIPDEALPAFAKGLGI